MALYPGRSVRLHPNLAARLEPGLVEHPYLDSGRYGREAEQIIVKTLNFAIGLEQEDREMSYLMPEVLVHLVPLRRDAEAWGRQAEWLIGLARTVAQLVADGKVVAENALAWSRFATAIDAVAAGRVSDITGLDATWTSKPLL